jgi:hypothetical protein
MACAVCIALSLSLGTPLGVHAAATLVPNPGSSEGPAHSAAEEMALVDRQLSFIGFSRNQSVCAWRETTRRPAGTGYVDTTSTVLLVRLEDNKILATFRESPPHRTTRTGHFVHADPKSLMHRAPEYVHALPASSWARLRHKAHFSFKQSDFSDPTVRLDPDADSHLKVAAHDKVLHVTGDAGAPMGFGVLGRLNDGNLFALGHFRIEAYGQTSQRAEVQVYYSASGHSIAVLTRFLGPHVPLGLSHHGSMVQHRGSPIGYPDIGAENRAFEDGQGVEELFKDMHPEAAQQWEENVGNLF